MDAKLQSEGDIWEDRAARFLAEQGLRIIARNFRCRGGELDIIATDGPQLVFVEVRKRARSRFGSAVTSIHHRKQARLRHAAMYYLQTHSALRNASCRFDVIGWDTACDATPTPQWLRGAMPGF